MDFEAISFDALNITNDVIYKDMGYGNSIPDEEVSTLVSALLQEIPEHTAPRFTFKLFEGETGDDAVYLDNGVVLQVNSILASLLKNAEIFAIFAATAGTPFQQYQDRLKQEGDLLKTYVADAIGNCIAEGTGDCMETHLIAQTSDYKHTKRFSPGYCGWHLTGQRELFGLLGGSPCGISLSDVCLMTPIKSISGIIGIGRDVTEGIYGCRYCELKTCYKRKQ
ncbi:MAG: hypothetical protein LBR50_03620 [Tannerella sp.]|jgi:hypothetical protein|nr:hypothetical protein [Tannerella sp.]